jgi:pimeloyl-ACP methyl ester carboxylesterase
MAPAGDGRLHLATGIATAVTDDGEPSADPPVVLLHSWAAARRSFAALAPLVAPHVRTLAFDLRGHGDADKPAEGYDLPTLAADVVAALDALAVPRAVLVGASSGGYLAQQVAVSAPERVAGLVLAGTPHDLRGRPPFADELASIPDPVDPVWARRFLAGVTDLERLPSWYVDVLVEDAVRLPAAIWEAAFRGLNSSRPPTDLGVVSAPTLVISGGRDGLLGRAQTDALVAAVPDAQWIEYEDTGHLVLEEQPARLAADVLSFMADLAEDDGS